MTDVYPFLRSRWGASPSLCRSYCTIVGGWESVVAKLPPEQLGFTKVGWKTIIGLIIMYFMTFSTGQESVQRYFAAKDEKTAVLGPSFVVLSWLYLPRSCRIGPRSIG